MKDTLSWLATLFDDITTLGFTPYAKLDAVKGDNSFYLFSHVTQTAYHFETWHDVDTFLKSYLED